MLKVSFSEWNMWAVLWKQTDFSSYQKNLFVNSQFYKNFLWFHEFFMKTNKNGNIRIITSYEITKLMSDGKLNLMSRSNLLAIAALLLLLDGLLLLYWIKYFYVASISMSATKLFDLTTIGQPVNWCQEEERTNDLWMKLIKFKVSQLLTIAKPIRAVATAPEKTLDGIIICTFNP